MVNLAAIVFLISFQQPTAAPKPLVCIADWQAQGDIKAASEDAIMTALLATGKFRVTENCEKADYAIKGSIMERADIKSRSESESAHSGSLIGSASRSLATIGGSKQGSVEGLSSTETKRSILISARLIDKEGDVLLSLSQDAAPSKNRSAISEGADKLAKAVSQKLFGAATPADKSKPSKDGYVKIK